MPEEDLGTVYREHALRILDDLEERFGERIRVVSVGAYSDSEGERR